MTHNYTPPESLDCLICGTSELDHFNRCDKCEAVWNGNTEHVCVKVIENIHE